MTPETRQCKNCQKSFVIEPDDFGFYEQMKVPPPTWCPQCRLVRRLMWRNERALYKRKCDLCGVEKIMMYSPDAKYKVYCKECWWSDRWSAKDFARDYDLARPFFDQFNDLMHAVPQLGIVQQGMSVQSEYSNRVTDPNHCYLVFGSTRPDHCRYGSWLNDDKDCLDCYAVEKSELCYESVDCLQCNRLFFSQECTACADSWLLLNCRNCTNCFGCVNLRGKSYCIWNEQYSKEEYAEKIAELKKDLPAALAQFEEFKKKFPVPAIVTHQSQNVSGNLIEKSKNVYYSFSIRDSEDVRYSFALFQVKDAMDYSRWGDNSERIYECESVGIQAADMKFCSLCYTSIRNCEYCKSCVSSQNLFGCVGIRKGESCILNKQYSKEEFAQQVSRIKEQMRRDGEYGEFFPMEISSFAYHETLAQEFFPRSFPPIPVRDYKIGGDILACAHNGTCADMCTTAFRVLPDDRVFYNRFGLSVPTLCPNCRHAARLAKRTPLRLYSRTCSKCSKEIETSFAADRPEIVYCESCYQQEVA